LAIPLKYDDTKAREELGWKLEYSLEKMINDFNKEINK
jgi:nucleoside-diphosphate-sugar epimerase